MRSRRNVMPGRFTCLMADLFMLTMTIGAIGFVVVAGIEVFKMAVEAF